MSIKDIITVPDETLKKISEPLEKVSANEKKLINDLFDTMYHHKGIGLAAIQIGVPKRIIVMDISKDEKKKNPMFFVNPIIKNKNSILRLGQQLTIGNKNIHRNIESKKRTILYSVKQGDNLYKISDIFDVIVQSIKQINEFESSDLMPGQIIKIAIRAF